MTEFTQLYLTPKIFLMGSSLAFSLKEDPVRCAKVCDKSWVILMARYLEGINPSHLKVCISISSYRIIPEVFIFFCLSKVAPIPGSLSFLDLVHVLLLHPSSYSLGGCQRHPTWYSHYYAALAQIWKTLRILTMQCTSWDKVNLKGST